MNAQQILDFWFSPETEPYWFAKSDAFDAKIHAQFLAGVVQFPQVTLGEADVPLTVHVRAAVSDFDQQFLGLGGRFRFNYEPRFEVRGGSVTLAAMNGLLDHETLH